MSGICGIIRLDGARASSRDLDRQIKRLAHLGPDRIRASVDGRAAMAHLMMRITREDRLDFQPVVEGDFTLVADVRLDNREDLGADLGIDGEALARMPDSALVLAAWRRWGEDAPDHLLGDFAFAVWEADAGRLHLVRDHMGQRHIFYHKGDGFLAFASEIKGLWALPQVPRAIDEDRTVRSMLQEALDVGATNFEAIRAVPGGSVVTLDPAGEISVRRYWEPHAAPEHLGRDEAYYLETYRALVSEAVQCRLRRSEWAGGLLNGGGFDSSAICALAGPAVAPRGLKFVSACSVMPDDYDGPIKDARKWVALCHRHMPHLEARYVTREGLDVFSFMEEGFRSFDNRHSPNRYITHSLFAAIRDAGARIVMDGHGGDYTVNPRGLDGLARLVKRGRLLRFVRELRATARHQRRSVLGVLRDDVFRWLQPRWLRDARRRWHDGLRPFATSQPLSGKVLAEARARGSRVWNSGTDRGGPRAMMERVLRWQQNFPAQAFSVAGAQHGLEFTQPFHDKRLVEFGLAIPEDYDLKHGKTRWLARTALEDLYPPEYQDRRPGNDALAPDFEIMARRIEPRTLAEIDRMERAGRLSDIFDFARMRAMIVARPEGQPGTRSDRKIRQACGAFLAARSIEWFRGDNG